MPIELPTYAPPLRLDPSGALRVGESRVLFELVITAFQDGATPEAIVLRYPTTNLRDVYAVITYYLSYRADADRYLVDREQAAAEVRQSIESTQGDLAEIRERLLAKRTSQG